VAKKNALINSIEYLRSSLDEVSAALLNIERAEDIIRSPNARHATKTTQLTTFAQVGIGDLDFFATCFAVGFITFFVFFIIINY
jgi:hypothetical protein